MCSLFVEMVKKFIYCLCKSKKFYEKMIPLLVTCSTCIFALHSRLVFHLKCFAVYMYLEMDSQGKLIGLLVY